MFFVAAVAAYDLVWIWQAVTLPERVPAQWFSDGTVVEPALSRTTALAQSAVLGLTVAALCIVVALVAAGLPGRTPSSRRRLLEDVWALGAVTMAYVAVTEVIGLPALRARGEQMSIRFDTAAVAFAIALLCVLGFAVLRRRRTAARPLGTGAGPLA